MSLGWEHEGVLTCGLHEGQCITAHDAFAHRSETQECIKISIPKLVVCLKQTHVFQWCMVECGSNFGHEPNMCRKRIEVQQF